MFPVEATAASHWLLLTAMAGRRPLLNSLSHAAPKCPSYTDVSPLSSPSPNPPIPPASDARSARTDHMNALGPVSQRLDHHLRIEHLVADRVVDFIQHHQVIGAAVDRGSPGFPAFLCQLSVLGVRFRSANLHESAAHGPDFKLVVAEHLRRIQLAVVPRSLDELHHQHAQPLPDRAKRCSERASRLSLARPRINNQQSLLIRHS